MNRRIAVVLPRKEGFAISRFGAIALTVEDYVRHSRWRDVTQVLGVEVADPRLPDVFHAIVPRDRWWRSRNHAFALGCAQYLRDAPTGHAPAHIDVHNRVETFHCMAEQFPDAAVSLWFHNDPLTMRGSKRASGRQAIADRAWRVFCVSDWVRRRFVQGVQRHAERAVVFPNAMTMPAEHPSQTTGEKENLILFVGRFNRDKGVLLFAEALAQALAVLPEWRGAMVGQGKPGMTRQICALLQPVASRVSMPGFRPHAAVMAAFGRAAIVVVPSLWDEPFGRTALEAMASGCAVIATARGGLPEVVGDCSVVLDPAEPDRLAQLIVALANDPGRRSALQRLAAEYAAEQFAIQPWAARLDDLRASVDPALK